MSAPAAPAAPTPVSPAVAALVEVALHGHETDPALAGVVTEMARDVLAVVGPEPAPQAGDDDAVDAQLVLAEATSAATTAVFAPDPLADLDSEPHALAESDPSTAAARAAARAGVTVRAVETHADVAAAVAVLDAVFAPAGSGHFYPPSLLRNILAAGAPVLLACDGDAVVGVILALPGWGEAGPVVQSGPMAVLPAARGRGIALALKFAQRDWCLTRGVGEVRWNYDLMVRTNARLNLHTLRAEAVEFLPGYEGVRTQGTAPALPHDRLLVRWDLTATPPVRRLPAQHPVRTHHAVREEAGRPVVSERWQDADVALVALPENIHRLRQNDPVLAAQWQHAVGRTLQAGLAAGWRLDVDPEGRYRLTTPGLTTG